MKPGHNNVQGTARFAWKRQLFSTKKEKQKDWMQVTKRNFKEDSFALTILVMLSIIPQVLEVRRCLKPTMHIDELSKSVL